MLEKAIKLLKQYQGYEPMFPDGETLKRAFDLTDETVDTLLTALRPVSREQIEKVWRGEWTGSFNAHCSLCGAFSTMAYIRKSGNFCANCGAPMTDEAVQMVMERMKELKDGKGD